MNLQTLVLSIITCISIFGCKKNEPEMVFDITGIPNIKIRYTEAQIISLSAVHISGSKDDLSLTAEGLPEGATITFKLNVQAVPFDFHMFLNTKNVKGGDYTFKIKGKPSHSTASTSFDVKMHVADLEDIGCALEIAGKYEGHPTSSDIQMSRPSIAPNSAKSQVVFLNCSPGFYANMDCYKQTLEIPNQKTSSGLYVSGYGSFDLKTVSLNINVYNVDLGSMKNHTFTLVRPSAIE